MNNFQYDAIIVLGGGRNDKGLTNLSKQRLDVGARIFKEGKVGKIIALGGAASTFPLKGRNVFEYSTPGSQLRRQYLQDLGVPSDNIVEISCGADTICEAFAVAQWCKENGVSKVDLVTSDKHMERASFIFNEVFRRIFKGKDFEIGREEVPCGDILNTEAERELLNLTREFFAQLPEDDLPNFDNWCEWYQRHEGFYEKQLEIQNRHYSKECEAYAGVKEAK